MLYNKGTLKSIKEYIIKSFIFCYNNYYPTHQKAKYSTSYWLQELKLNVLKGIKKVDLLQEIDQDLIATFNKVLAAVVLQEYTKVVKNIKKEVLIAAYQELENY